MSHVSLHCDEDSASSSEFTSTPSAAASGSSAAATGTQWGMNRAAVAANCCTSPLPCISFPPHICLLTFSFPFPSCFKHGRVNLLILQAASLSIYLSSCPPPPNPSPLLSGRAVLSGSSRAVGLSGVMDDYQPSAVFHYAPGRFTGSLTTRHENQSLLSHSSLPSSIHAILTPSISLPLFQHLLHCQKKPP